MDHGQKTFIDLLLVLLILGLVVGCGCPNADQQKPTSRQTDNPETSNISIEISQLASEFKENEARANQIYKGKHITVTGAVATVGDYNGKTVLFFIHGMLNPETLCFFEDVNELSQLRSNQPVTIKATVLGFSNDKISVVLEDCRLQ